jgi:hypothetical protein
VRADARPEEKAGTPGEEEVADDSRCVDSVVGLVGVEVLTGIAIPAFVGRAYPIRKPSMRQVLEGSRLAVPAGEPVPES